MGSIKSIFRRREIEKIYDVVKRDMEFHSIGRIIRSENIDISEKDINVLSDKVIGEYELEFPMLKIGDEFYLNDIDEIVVIKSKMRNSSNAIVYYVEDKTIETDRTIESKIKAEERLNNWSQLKEENKTLLQYKESHPYQHRFFNFKCD